MYSGSKDDACNDGADEHSGATKDADVACGVGLVKARFREGRLKEDQRSQRGDDKCR